MPRYVLFHKPYGVLSQFTPEDGARSLAEFDLPAGIYPAGRLDKDSEGLLLLTDDGPLIEQLLNPRNAKPKAYWALVERVPDEAALQRLRSGLRIEDYVTRPCQAHILQPQPEVPPRDPPVRLRKSVQDVWLQITVVEGKNRQVRKMTAAIGHPTLRLIRRSIANLTLDGSDGAHETLAPGQWREISRADIAWEVPQEGPRQMPSSAPRTNARRSPAQRPRFAAPRGGQRSRSGGSGNRAGRSSP